MTTIIVDDGGTIDLPEEVLQASRIAPGSQLVVLAREGRIVLLDRERFRRQVEQPAQAFLGSIRHSLERDPDLPFFGGLTLAEYAALSEEAEEGLWDWLTREARGKVSEGEQEIPAHFRPAGQERR